MMPTSVRHPTMTAPVPAPAVTLTAVSKTYGHGLAAVQAVDGVSLTVREGEFICLVGASGCGKSTLLNLIAGLEQPTSGKVVLPRGRTSLMFQDAALFPWLTAAENVEFPLRMLGVPKGQRRRRAAELLQTVHLMGFERKRPHQLSGGMRQRVALARALAHGANVLLMDEPFGALDAMIRDTLHGELEQVWAATGATVVFVTHNVREAVRLADRVVLLSSRPGRVAAEYAVDLPRPRRGEAPEVAALAAEVTRRLHVEARHHAA
jgi:NitT/TauT family transport system ATP-binding protein